MSLPASLDRARDLPPGGLDDLARLVGTKRVRLATTIGVQAFVGLPTADLAPGYLDPDALVATVVDLARVGLALMHASADERPGAHFGPIAKTIRNEVRRQCAGGAILQETDA